jgi:hypothetical protein
MERKNLEKLTKRELIDLMMEHYDCLKRVAKRHKDDYDKGNSDMNDWNFTYYAGKNFCE